MNSNYQKTVLDNGLRVVTEHIPTVRSVAIGVWVMTGGRYEKAEQQGISHFLEHMVFKGTEKRTSFDIAHSLESLGGLLNAFTGKEQTCYYARILDEHLPIAVDVLSDILLHSRFEGQELEKEKKVVVEEINTMEDTPDDLIHDLYAQNLYGGHPLGWSVLGKREVIGRLTREDLAAYLAGHYGAGQVVIAAAGNVDHQALVDLAAQHFTFGKADFPGRHDLGRPLPARAVMYKKEILQAHVCLGTTGLPYCHPDRFNLLVLNTILGSGMSSRLFQNIREKAGLAYSVYSYLDFFHDTGAFATYIATEPGQARQAVRLILKEYADLVNNELKPDELETCKSQLKGNLLLGLESTNNRMTHLARTEIYLKRFVGLDELIRDIDRVTAMDVRRAAGELLDPERLCLTVLSPLEVGTIKVDDLKYPI